MIQPVLTQAQVQHALNLCTVSLGSYARAVRPDYEIPCHIDIIIQALEKIERGEWKRLIIQAPPRHSKSMTATTLFPAWYQGKHPEKKVMICCHTQQLATEFGLDIQNLIVDEMHMAIFPDHRLTHQAKSKKSWTTTRRGKFFAAGIQGGATGRGADILIIDDPIRTKQDAASPIMRKRVHDFYTSVARTRLQPNGAIIVISTRWHENDLIGWLLDPTFQVKVDDWKIIDLPAIAEQDEGWRQPGDALWPQWFDLKTLESTRDAVGQWDWMAMFQQRPSAVEGRLVKRAWLKHFAWHPFLAKSRNLSSYLTQPFQIYQSWDTAYKIEEENDYSVCTTWLSTGSGEYLLDVQRVKLEAPGLQALVKDHALEWNVDAILIEEQAGHALIQNMKELQRLSSDPQFSKIPIIGINPSNKGAKYIRLQAISPYFVAGHIYLPSEVNAPWYSTYVNELCSFPTGTHDDQVDSTSQFLNWMKEEQRRAREWAEVEQPQRSFGLYG